MRKITIGFSKSKKKCAIGSALIRWYMGTSYSHVYLKFDAKSYNRSLVYEAVGAGVRFVGMNNWAKDHEEVASFEIEISDESYKKIMLFCIDNSGLKYGYMQNIGILLADIFKLSKNPLTDGDNCSEAIGEILILEGYKIDKDLNLLTPKDIFLILDNKTI
jgi:hypothetical protein